MKTRRILVGLNKEIKHGYRVPFFVLFAVMFLFFLMVNSDFSDDGVALAAMQTSTPWEHAVNFQELSSRFLINLTHYTLITLPPFVFAVANALVYVLAAYAIPVLLGASKNRYINWVSCFAVMLYPVSELINASWIAGSTNYLWAIAFGMYAMIPWKKYLSDEKVGLHTLFLSIPALAYATFAQQMMAVLGGFLMVAVVYMLLFRKKFRVYYALSVATYAAVTVYAMTLPSTSLRTGGDIRAYYPDFGAVTRLEKLYDGFMLTSNRFIGLGGNITVLLASAAVVYLVFKNRKEIIYRVFAAAQMAVLFSYSLFYPLLSELFPVLKYLPEKRVDINTFATVSSYVSFVVYILVWALVALSVYLAFSDRLMGLFMLVVLLAGFAAVLMLSFAPSIHYSKPRFYIFIHYAFIFITIACAKELKTDKSRSILLYSSAGLAAFSYLSLFMVI